MDVNFALGMRVKCRSCMVLSTRAMLKSAPSRQDAILSREDREVSVPMPICCAFSCAASEAIFAASSESVGSCLVAGILAGSRA